MNSGKKILIANLFIFSLFIHANAEEIIPITKTPLGASTTTADTINITLSLNTNDLLMFYGITNSTDTNISISDLRKDFIEKFNTIRNEYQNKLNNTIGSTTLNLPITLQGEEKISYLSSSSSKKTISSKKVYIPAYKNATTSQNEALNIDHVVNILNLGTSDIQTDTGTIHIENKG
jgi:hypothetical protein